MSRRALLTGLLPLALGLSVGCAYIAGIHGADPRCENGKHDPGEGGGAERIDCGGICFGKCEGEACSGDVDCASAVCGGDSTCKASRCDDDAWNGQESDQNCGGPACARCANGKHCRTNGDCLSAACGADGKCSSSSCTDKEMNQGEEGVDCGGPHGCAACDGTLCVSRADCRSGNCVNEVCRASTCVADPQSDGCAAGACGLCWEQPCAVAEECWSHRCEGGQCVPP